STGGVGQIYAFTTNPFGATGDGLGAAYRAKVKLEKLPYIQFHPTALFPKVDGETFLITEALRGEGALLQNLSGEQFMGKYHPLKELAPRDIVARSIIREMLVQKETNVNLDATVINKDILLNHFPNIIETCRSIGIDPCSTPIPVVPAAHYSCGGIGVDEHSKTTLEGLYAIGECSHTGLHGANRLASNSLLESIVFSHRAALNSVENLKEITLSSSFYEAIPDWKGQHFSKDNQQEVTHTLSEQLRKIMSEQVGIFKTTEGLITAQTNIKKLYFAVVDLYNSNKLSPQICELRNMVSVAYVLVNQSLEITKNKGVFYNHNYGKEPVL
ncbi:FAD-binding protein, partial [Flavobacteriaceae bacterium]|nr:FAD-binding protein [Flavobacteriaceae bacterium]